MNQEYRKWLQHAATKNAENKKFLDKLKKAKPADLDTVCNDLHEKAFDNIDCLDCANCCTTTGPLLLQKDIERAAKALKLRPAVFAQTYLKVDEDGDNVFTHMPCPFLGHDKYCSIYADRPNACREFPHTQQRNMLQKLKITHHNTLICPAVAQVVEGLKKKYSR